MMFVQRGLQIHLKLARSSQDVSLKFEQSWPEAGPKLIQSCLEVCTKLSLSSYEVNPKFVRSWPGAKLAHSFLAKFSSKW